VGVNNKQRRAAKKKSKSRHRARAAGETAAMFPHLVSRPAAIGNARGWAAGRVAADLAVLGTDDQLTEAS
jgi:hypothetical protein